MNVQTREQFDQALEALRNASVVVCDTETNTLKVRSAHKMPLVSIQLHLPESNQSFNFPFRQGYGDLFDSNGDVIDPISISFDSPDPIVDRSGRDRRTAYWYRLWNWWKDTHDFGNLPVEWMDELKAVWTDDKKYIYHNANFDLTVLDREGYPEMSNVEDTMIALQMVWGDWGGKRSRDDKGIKVDMPARYGGGKEWGNRKLKWQARFWDFDDAEAGEQALADNANDFIWEVCEYAVKSVENDQNLHDYLFPLGSYASWRKNPDLTDYDNKTWHYRQTLDLLNKVSWNDKELKGRLWMLPSDAVLKYGVLDVILTSQLYDKCMGIIEGWGVEDIYNEISAINMGLAWRMEQYGLLIDVEEANLRIAKNYAEAQAIMDKYDWNIDSWQEFKARVGDHLGLPDTQAGTVRKALEWIDPDLEYGTDDKWIIGAQAIQVINDRLAYKRIIKQTSTYLKRWVDAVDNNNIVHAYIDVAGTKTGRTSSGGDMGNVQNIPSRSANVKEVIITPDDYLVFGVDYSNLELRVASWIAENILGFGNMEMTNAINNGDAHAKTAEDLNVRYLMYGNKTDREIAEYENMAGWQDMDDDLLKKLVYKFFIRQIGKTANFNLIYGGSHWSLGIQMGEDFETDEDDDSNEHWDILYKRFDVYNVLHERWHEMYPAFMQASEYFRQQALEWRPAPSGKGSFQYNMNILPYYRSLGRPVTDWRMGRPIKHHLYDDLRWMPKKHGSGVEAVEVKKYSAKKAWNNIVQGSSSHINVHSGWRFYNGNPSHNVKLFAGIHDALDGYAHVNHLDEVINLMEIMEDWGVEPKLDVELEAGLSNWQHMKEVKNLSLWVESKGREGYD